MSFVRRTVYRVTGFALVELVVVLAVLAGGLFVAKPSWFPGASKRAAKSTEATTKVEQAVDAQGAAVAASVVKIGEANAVAPESPSRAFIGQEVPVALARLPAPDAKALIEAERRRAAVMEGRLEEARKLYEVAAKQSERLQKERDEAFAARREADLALEKAAAVEHSRTMQMLGLGVVVVLLAAAWLYTRIYSISPETIGKVAADVRSGMNPISALNTHLSPRLHNRVRKAAKLATEPADDPT
jgi:hypothetical protein